MASIEKTKIITRSHSAFCPSRGTLDFNEVTGMIEWGAKIKTPKNPKRFQQNPQKIPGPTLITKKIPC